MEATRITKEELSSMNTLGSDIFKAKIALANIELEKNSLLKAIDGMSIQAKKMQDKLAEKYGEGASIDPNTGEIKYEGLIK